MCSGGNERFHGPLAPKILAHKYSHSKWFLHGVLNRDYVQLLANMWTNYPLHAEPLAIRARRHPSVAFE